MAEQQQAVFAAGCFWGVEAAFRAGPGVVDVEVGYTGGITERPTYEEVCTDRTGHAEAVKVTYDPEKVSYRDLVQKFFSIHNPTQRDGQGLDVGTQYRSAIFYGSEEERTIAEEEKEALAAQKAHGERVVVTEIVPQGPWYRAEEYHQQYHEKHGGVC